MKRADSCLMQAVTVLFSADVICLLVTCHRRNPDLPIIANVKRKEYGDSDHSALQIKVKFLTEKEEIRRLYC